MVYLGGSVLADIMKEQDDFWITKKEWVEKGCDKAIAEHHKLPTK